VPRLPLVRLMTSRVGSPEQKPVVIAKVANVTARDIETGEQGMADTCPLAHACLRLFPGKYVTVGAEHINVFTGSFVSDEELPLWESEWLHDGKDFVNRFDDGLDVEPRKVNLRLYYERIPDDSTST
jgi:hypothetical protein